MLPPDYLERVYAGVLGKIIGVYLGRPFEGWTYERLMADLGEVNYYVHERLGVPLIVTDDDISGTFTFLRALPDYGCRADLSAAHIGETWLNYLIENRTVLWWGGLGNSTEHTAYLRLKQGIPAPRSGSIAVNGKVVAEQIGAQIFIDGWAMVAPGDPALAADLARRAGSVSHDGEALYGAMVLAALESQAFVEHDVNRLLDTAVRYIPRDSVIYRLVSDMREWRGKFPDWHKARELITEFYGYDKYGGNCHMVPNHALVLLGLLYGGDDFQKALTITNTSGWDTDCNSGNIGCLEGIRLGLAGINAGPDWRGPVADRLYLPTADGGSAVTDAVRETYKITNIGRALQGLPDLHPKREARFHFELPGSVQGFTAEESAETSHILSLENVTGHSTHGIRSLALHYKNLATGRAARARTATFIPPESARMPGYGLIASPTLYPGQTVHAELSTDINNAAPVTGQLYLSYYAPGDQVARAYGPEVLFKPGEVVSLDWKIGDLSGSPICEIGLELRSSSRVGGTIYLDTLSWSGTPNATFTRPFGAGVMWRNAWVNGVDHFESWGDPFRLIQDVGRGLIITGTRDWTDYRVSADVTPHMVSAAGLAARVQGMRRYYGLLLVPGKLRLVKMLAMEAVLAEIPMTWTFGETCNLALAVQGNLIRGYVEGRLVIEAEDSSFAGGGIGLVVEEGRTATQFVQIEPLAV